MADVAGQPRSDLGRGVEEPLATGFFELLRRLETPAARIGRAGGPEREPVRLGQRVRLSMATRDIAAFHPGDGATPARVDAEVLGLFGPEGAMPLHLTRWIMERLSERWFARGEDRESADTTFLDFANMLQHRMLALYWRAWADARPQVQTELGAGGRVAALIDTLAGTGLPGMQRAGPEAAALMRRHGTDLAQSANGPERLTRILADLLSAPVRLAEFTGHWMAIPPPLQSRVGRTHARLGRGAVVGARTFQRQTRAEIVVGPLDLAAYQRLIDDPALRGRLSHAVLFAAGREIDFDLRLVLRRSEVPAARLDSVRLGRTAWIPGKTAGDADDLRFSRITRDRPGDGVEAA